MKKSGRAEPPPSVVAEGCQWSPGANGHRQAVQEASAQSVMQIARRGSFHVVDQVCGRRYMVMMLDVADQRRDLAFAV